MKEIHSDTRILNPVLHHSNGILPEIPVILPKIDSSYLAPSYMPAEIENPYESPATVEDAGPTSGNDRQDPKRPTTRWQATLAGLRRGAVLGAGFGCATCLLIMIFFLFDDGRLTRLSISEFVYLAFVTGLGMLGYGLTGATLGAMLFGLLASIRFRVTQELPPGDAQNKTVASNLPP